MRVRVMKNLLVLSFLCVFVYSCNKADANSDFDTSNFSTNTFVGNVVAFKTNQEVQLGIADTDLILSFNNYSKTLNLGLVAVSSQIKKQDNKYYLRFINKDASVSTVALLNSTTDSGKTNSYAIGKTLCTTTALANCSGCIPNGDYCSSCENDSSICTRTTSG
ncbi:hypothetical protein KO494_15310 [Lacinutrix sp. C3R15]|uniref:hypothetical protein n=1 Tax=Flavobacteriaceae TaxID=49546 RepID=UPI001C09EEFA|nr:MULTISPECIES: hypothetical protein [Flavobacteriaceae]MBU2940917.1 hypothetical protein [Lacinutrix sp. C3R15]MDO6624236.1 hypothetical protein [Oceanihabitans sp. 1_MG-2023]